MYGATGTSDYDSTHANTNKSTILTNLETWYTNNLTTYEDKLADTIWCSDKSIVTDTTYDPLNYSDVNGLGYTKNVTYYGATQRLVSANNSAGGTGPTLKCNGELSEITTNIGLLSADELVFAGYAYVLENTSTFLQENATGAYWWTLSPVDFSGSDAFVWNVVGDHGVLLDDFVNFDNGVRPSISLKSSVTVTGDGTSEAPYVID